MSRRKRRIVQALKSLFAAKKYLPEDHAEFEALAALSHRVYEEYATSRGITLPQEEK